ncbi:hypothetical protein CSAL01_13593 [Colletotrichum salicis]|uniref:Uncharacterized protein n=1 Tax=Colletotrichum salicis TaxID=1209931 RepID=A0A135U2T7_9PEZI|nr:hypothetical protein CSAL01_13593 [Colletotrichum salicis]
MGKKWAFRGLGESAVHWHPMGYLEARDTCGRTALSWSAINGQTSVTKLLLEMGADMKMLCCDFAPTPLSLAFDEERTEVIELLLRNGADINLTDKYGRSLLSWATTKGEEGIGKLLLQNGANVDLADDYYQRALISLAAITLRFVDLRKSTLLSAASVA